KHIAPFVGLVHAVDSQRLLAEINKEAKKNKRTIPCLLQLKIAEEASKYGLCEAEALQLLKRSKTEHFKNITVEGFMGMATFTGNESKLKAEFSKLKAFFELHKGAFQLKTLSMGMSGDHKVAIAVGSTMVRVGSAIFGARDN
ncbi:MAG: YggS family pyridoxal phosphate-dependent enzyme, partial [Marinirhabdus sp.]